MTYSTTSLTEWRHLSTCVRQRVGSLRHRDSACASLTTRPARMSFSGLLISERSHRCDDRGSTDLWRVGQFLRDYKTQHPRRQSSSYLTRWEPEIAQYMILYRIQCQRNGCTTVILFLARRGNSFFTTTSRHNLGPMKSLLIHWAPKVISPAVARLEGDVDRTASTVKGFKAFSFTSILATRFHDV
jgi:hypothetical protein